MIHEATFGDTLAELRTEIPGPRSRALTERLRRVESRNITYVDRHGPIFWAEAAGANVRDVDGNVFVDLTAGFGVAAAGHRNAAVVGAARAQLGLLVHAMGDVHPAEAKLLLLERLAELAPGDLSVGILGSNGSDAMEAALKTAVLATGRPGVVAFRGAYHGLGYGALATTHAARFRAPFARQLYGGVRFAPYPGTSPADADYVGDVVPATGEESGASVEASLAAVRDFIRASLDGPDPVGAVVVEPILGRGGIVAPSDDFLPGLRSLCSAEGVLLIVDEIYTGLGRTGRWFACQHQDVVPDLLVLGKSLAGGLPLSAVLGSPALMEAWPPSTGEAIHTSTFLGHPVACAAALANLNEIEARGLVARAASLGQRLEGWLTEIAARSPEVGAPRGLGLMRALPLTGAAPEARASDVMARALARGVIVLPEGPALAFTPPLTISERQLRFALDVVEAALAGE